MQTGVSRTVTGGGCGPGTRALPWLGRGGPMGGVFQVQGHLGAPVGVHWMGW